MPQRSRLKKNQTKASAQVEQREEMLEQATSTSSHFYIDQNNIGTAIKFYEELIELNPGNAFAYDRLSQLHARLGQEKMARSHLDNAEAIREQWSNTNQQHPMIQERTSASSSAQVQQQRDRVSKEALLARTKEHEKSQTSTTRSKDPNSGSSSEHKSMVRRG